MDNIDKQHITDDTNRQPIIGDIVNITFTSVGNKCVPGKVDTGATNSSLHATEISVHGDSVTFYCPELSDNKITMELNGTQEVVSADAGGQNRPIVFFDIEVGGISLQKVLFNLNDRSEMDTPILIGQNIIKAGHFLVDINKQSDECSTEAQATTNMGEGVLFEKESKSKKEVMEAIKVLKKHKVTIFELVEFLRTAPLYLRNGDVDD